jgi:hypothetical protein
MIGTLYRYPHPHDSTRFIYVGQGPKRDLRHRSGESSFGRRFKSLYPDVDLPQPIKEEIEVFSQLELNEEETIWMFRYHTWRGYPDGMNLTFPGSFDYKNMGLVQGHRNAESGHMQAIGRIYGRKHVESGRLASIRTKEACSKGGKAAMKNMPIETRIRAGKNGSHEDKVRAGKIGGKIGGKIAVESGHLARIQVMGGKISGRKMVESGQLDRIRSLPQTKAAQRKAGLENGRKAVESGQFDRMRNSPEARAARLAAVRKRVESGDWDRIKNLPQTIIAQRESGYKAVESGHLLSISFKGSCARWRIRRGKSCTCGKHLAEDKK